MLKNIDKTSTLTIVCRSSHVMAGVSKGASNVLTLVMPTDRATSPFDK